MKTLSLMNFLLFYSNIFTFRGRGQIEGSAGGWGFAGNSYSHGKKNFWVNLRVLRLRFFRGGYFWTLIPSELYNHENFEGHGKFNHVFITAENAERRGKKTVPGLLD